MISISWMQAMEYRSDFISWMLVDTGWSIMDLAFFTSLINFTQVIGDWNKGQSLVVLGVFSFWSFRFGVGCLIVFICCLV